MCTIQILSKLLFISLVITLFINSTSSHAQELLWPIKKKRADFEFLRNDVIKDLRVKKGSNVELYIATLGDLIQAYEIDPFTPKPITDDIGKSKYSNSSLQKKDDIKGNRSLQEAFPELKVDEKVNVQDEHGRTVKGTLTEDWKVKLLTNNKVIAVTVNSEGDIMEVVSNKLNISKAFKQLFSTGDFTFNNDSNNKANNSNSKQASNDEISSIIKLNLTMINEASNISAQNRIDLNDFITFLETLLMQTNYKQELVLDEYNFSKELSKIKINAISVSPSKYVILNKTRYNVGDKIPLSINIKVKPSNEIDKIINAYMPEEKEVTKNVYELYQGLAKQALNKHQKLSEKYKSTSNNSNNVTAIIKSIKSKKIIVSVLGKEYPLKLKLFL